MDDQQVQELQMVHQMALQKIGALVLENDALRNALQQPNIMRVPMDEEEDDGVWGDIDDDDDGEDGSETDKQEGDESAKDEGDEPEERTSSERPASADSRREGQRDNNGSERVQGVRAGDSGAPVDRDPAVGVGATRGE